MRRRLFDVQHLDSFCISKFSHVSESRKTAAHETRFFGLFFSDFILISTFYRVFFWVVYQIQQEGMQPLIAAVGLQFSLDGISFNAGMQF